MREWKLTPGDPLQLTLSADARLSQTDYQDDQIWELDLGGGDPAALAVRTTYGLRARLMRVFPRFLREGVAYHDPLQFPVGVQVRRFYPNFLLLTFSPLPGLLVTAEYWAAESKVMVSRLTLTNRSASVLPLTLEIAAQLIPLEGQSMSAAQRQSVHILEGQAENLAPALFLTGGPQAGQGPYPSLTLALDLEPGATRLATWALASLQSPQESFEAARRSAARPLDAERAQITRLNESQTYQIYTGDPDWDAALALSQKSAQGLFMGATEHLPHPSFVSSRQPDQGYASPTHNHQWSGQTPQDALYLASLLPCQSEMMRGALLNFLSVQEKTSGAIDNKPGLAGQRGRFLAAPFLASLAWRLSCAGTDRDLLTKTYPALLAFFWSWFSPARDQDRNGIPEWQHPSQTGFEDNPLFNGWNAWAQGVHINTVQSPSLTAALFQEANHLIHMAELLGRNADATLLRAQQKTLQESLQSSWDADAALYRYTDRDTHLSMPAKSLSERQASNSITLQKEFKHPVRLIIRIGGQDQALKRPRVQIEGSLEGNPQTETLDAQAFAFSADGAVATSRKIYSSLGNFQFEGLTRKDRVSIQTVDLTISDHSLLLPLWAKAPDEHQAQAMVFRTILEASQFDHPYGIPALPRFSVRAADPLSLGVHLPWNSLIGEGLLAYGYRREAARLMAHLMSAVIQNLKQKQSFYATYHAETGAGQGERNALQGLAPIGLFLACLGVEIISPTRVILRAENPFPWPVTVKYKGLSVTRLMGQTEITFPNQQVSLHQDPTDAVISCEEGD